MSFVLKLEDVCRFNVACIMLSLRKYKNSLDETMSSRRISNPSAVVDTFSDYLAKACEKTYLDINIFWVSVISKSLHFYWLCWGHFDTFHSFGFFIKNVKMQEGFWVQTRKIFWYIWNKKNMLSFKKALWALHCSPWRFSVWIWNVKSLKCFETYCSELF